MFTPPVNLGSGMGYQLEFDLALTPYGGTRSATLGSDDKFAVVISTDGGTTWTSANTLQQWNSGTPISNTGNHIVINLSSYSGIVKFGFYGKFNREQRRQRLVRGQRPGAPTARRPSQLRC